MHQRTLETNLLTITVAAKLINLRSPGQKLYMGFISHSGLTPYSKYRKLNGKHRKTGNKSKRLVSDPGLQHLELMIKAFKLSLPRMNPRVIF